MKTSSSLHVPKRRLEAQMLDDSVAAIKPVTDLPLRTSMLMYSEVSEVTSWPGVLLS